jgi:arylsulfatase A-like enzyme
MPRNEASGARGPPNFLIVILDCGRPDDLPGGADPIPGMPFLESLYRESLSFPYAVAPSPWTVPSHASLFTGLYPWESGAHLKRKLTLDATWPTLPQVLGEHGYASFSASANGFISPDFGLVRGFTSAAWGDWWERFLHIPTNDRPPWALNYGPTLRLPQGSYWKMLEGPAKYANRRPLLLDMLNRFTSQLVQPGDTYSPYVGPWIEAAMSRWLSQQDPHRPVFAFVNYYEAHEPYIIDPALVEGGMSYWRLASLRMDRTSFLAGRWRPTAEEYRDLRRLSRAVIRSLDDRLRRLVEAFQNAGRWDNTILILASDHGQAFGERGFLFHGVRLWEPVIRIPLWIRWPDGRHKGEKATGWASLVDVMPTVLGEAGIPSPPLPSAVPLLDLLDHPRLGPVMAMSDGTPARKTLARMVPRSVWEPWDQAHLAAYLDGHKMILNVETGRVELFNLREDPGEARSLADPEVPPEFAPLADLLREKAQIVRSGRVDAPSAELDQRLQSWGYE